VGALILSLVLSWDFAPATQRVHDSGVPVKCGTGDRPFGDEREFPHFEIQRAVGPALILDSRYASISR